MPALISIAADQVAVLSGGPATLVFGQVDYDRRIWLVCSPPGVVVSHAPIKNVGQGFALPTNRLVQFDLPAKSQLWAQCAAGPVQLSRYSSPVMPTIGDTLTQVLVALAAKLGIKV